MDSSSSESSDTSESVIDGIDASPVVQIIAWLSLISSILSVAAQFATKQALGRKFKSADWVLLVALILSVAQIGVIMSPAGHGIGLTSDRQSVSAMDQALQALYASEIINIFARVTTKVALLVALLAITPDDRHRTIISATGVVTLLWGISNVFAIALQCPEPARWDIMHHGVRCIDLHAVRTFGAITNLILDIILIAIPSAIIIPVQMSWNQCIKILGGFWCRLVTVCACVVQIAFLYRSPAPFSLPNEGATNIGTDQAPDLLYEIYKPTINMLLVQNICNHGPVPKALPRNHARRQESKCGDASTGTGTSENTKKAGNNEMWSASRYIEIRRQRAWAVEEMKLHEGVHAVDRGKGFLGGGLSTRAVAASFAVRDGDRTGSE